MAQTNIVIFPPSKSKGYQLHSTHNYVNHKSKSVTPVWAPNTGILLHKITLPSYSLANNRPVRLKMGMCKQQFKVEWTCSFKTKREFLLVVVVWLTLKLCNNNFDYSFVSATKQLSFAVSSQKNYFNLIFYIFKILQQKKSENFIRALIIESSTKFYFISKFYNQKKKRMRILSQL